MTATRLVKVNTVTVKDIALAALSLGSVKPTCNSHVVVFPHTRRPIVPALSSASRLR